MRRRMGTDHHNRAGYEMKTDPITLELMRNRWTGIAEEMCAALIRTSYSTNIKDRRDCSAAIVQPSGEILAQAESGVPLHLGVMPGVVRSILDVYPVSAMKPGDVYITNLPYPEGPGHLPDVSLVSAIFHEHRPVALAASTAHHVDMGGFAPGSMPFGVTEIYQEGLQIPPLPIFKGGRLDE
ncbi:MAG: hydantoinase B/oxoprolinase family protein, partial [Gemmatimonadetes bacterium]|nr:hydantoinase B/oxoprolinase family protein [Gemmatimonadota bacterium]